MEKISQEIVIVKNKERFQRLKQIKNNLEKPNITNDLAYKQLKDLFEFTEITAKEINSLNISKILKKYWDSEDKDVKTITNDLICKWKKIAKAAAESNSPKSTNGNLGKPIIKEIKTQEIHSENCSNKLNSNKLCLNVDLFDIKIEEIKNLISLNPEFKFYSILRKTTQILLFESIAKIAKEKQTNQANKLNISTDTNDITTNSVNLENDFETELKFILLISEKITAALNNLYKDSKEKFIRKAKSIISNLRLNSELYSALFEERISPEDIANMDEKDMASKEIKLLRQKKEEESFNARRSDWDRLHNTFVSGMYKCGKCKQTKTTYFQAQIRRADEPMTTFVSCLNCNNNWKC